MTANATYRMRGRPLPDGPAAFTTLVELTWIEKRVESWIRFGNQSYEQKLDRQHRVVGFAPNAVFCFVRWAANEHGTIISRVDIVRTVDRGEPYQTLPFVRPGGEILLKIEGWPKVENVLRHVDGIDALGIDPADVDPDHWRHVAHWMNAGEAPRPYTSDRHQAWLRRREIVR
ncbi:MULTISPECIES: DUF2840 domain-containing protein [Rhizobium/Agrobacterium group]|uniref:Uncharacterized protein DUF2840 n=1 Tax=Rhizobium subbaraonis TaxID=908946 RepID=A0A285UYG9_9HYPH|nr:MULTISPECIES: DUF2840 domain-containing protein [Rhizobium/Agrobacterium group]WLS06936.1 DUF2840 domain-containing protein [Shinella sumterensis]MDH0871681.1 DUF2840 domain-containing protein [Agrobacterium pusense]TQN62488.1 DUF2840 domain-containing protein [Agrobacterium tumefaciens]CDN94530.1 hypothetical protein BN949_03700 [Agrobacterium tumefaciens]SOC46934.1 uncharacterized protein DUF2840 [Rhizobium subbaraonis]